MIDQHVALQTPRKLGILNGQFEWRATAGQPGQPNLRSMPQRTVLPGLKSSAIAAKTEASLRLAAIRRPREGWFVGGGVENNLNIFGLNDPGWFMKTEHPRHLQAVRADHQHLSRDRAAYLDRKNLQERVDGTGAPTGSAASRY